MSNQEKISIIIPVYNAEKYLRRCLDTVKNQTWENLEVLLLDDASTDGSSAICEEYAKEDDRVVVYHLSHCGVAAARNFAFEHMTGDYFMFVDADDLISKQYVERLYEVLKEKNAEVATCLEHCDHDPDIPSYEYTGKKKPEWKDISEYDFTRNWSHRTVWGAIFKKEVLGDLRFHPEYHCSTDTLFFAELLKRIKKVVYIDEKLYCYVYYDESVYHGKFNPKRYSEILVWERVAEMYREESEMAYISAVTNVVRYCYAGANKLLSQEPFDQELYDQLVTHVRGREDIVVQSSFSDKTRQELIFFCRHPELYQKMKQGSYAPHVWLLGGIDHGNLGDHQIVLSMEEFLRGIMPDIVFHEIPMMQYYAKKKYLLDSIRPQDLLLFAGGGNLGTLWPRLELLRRDAIATWPDNPKIIFPQSVFFSEDEEGKKELEISREAYRDSNCLLALRDEVSYKAATENFGCQLFLTPDIALYSEARKGRKPRKDCLFLMRSDKERWLQDQDAAFLQKMVEQHSLNVSYGDTVSKDPVSKGKREKTRDELFEKISSSCLVVTDRLHGLVFSAITGTPCIVFPNNHHKIEAAIHWLSDLPYIRFVSSTDDFDEALNSLNLDQTYEYPLEKMRSQFSDFREAVQDLLEQARIPRTESECKVSVVIPVYNVEEYLEKCLDSVVGQTLREIEIICVNDGSTDKSLSILRDYAQKDTRIRILDQTNGGLSAARNAGMEQAKGKYLYFLDSDDYIKADALKKMYHKMEEMQLDVLCFDVKPFSDDDAFEKRMEFLHSYYKRKKKYPGLYSGNEFMQMTFKQGDYLVPVWIHCYRNQFIKEAGLKFINGIYHEDNSFTFECMTKAKRIAYLPELLYYRYVRPNSITTIRQNYNHAYGYFACAAHMIRWIRDLERDDEFGSLYHEIINDTLRASREVYFKLPEEEQEKYRALPADEKSEFYELILLQKETDDLISGLRADVDGQKETVQEKDVQIEQYRRLLADNMARIDLKIFDGEAPSDFSVVSVSDRHAVITEPAWFNKDGKGIVLETTSHAVDLKLKCGSKGNLRIRPRGTDVRDEDGKREAHWIDYQSLKVNGQEKLGRTIAAWHDKPITIMIPVEVDDVVEIHIEWGQHESGRKGKLKNKVIKALRK